MKSVLGITLLTLVLAACGGGEKNVQKGSNEAAPQGQKPRNDLGITALDFQDATTPIDSAEITFEINGIGEFFNKIDLEGVKNADDGEKDCFANLFGDKTFRDSGRGYHVLASSTIDLSRCFSTNSDILHYLFWYILSFV